MFVFLPMVLLGFAAIAGTVFMSADGEDDATDEANGGAEPVSDVTQSVGDFLAGDTSDDSGVDAHASDAGQVEFEERRLGDADDHYSGGEPSDRIWGGAGDDRLSGRGDADELFGEGGDDILFGGTTTGGPYTETVDGFSDLLDGGLGDDILVLGADGDRGVGGEGHDTFVLTYDLGAENSNHNALEDLSPPVVEDFDPSKDDLVLYARSDGGWPDEMPPFSIENLRFEEWNDGEEGADLFLGDLLIARVHGASTEDIGSITINTSAVDLQPQSLEGTVNDDTINQNGLSNLVARGGPGDDRISLSAGGWDSWAQDADGFEVHGNEGDDDLRLSGFIRSSEEGPQVELRVSGTVDGGEGNDTINLQATTDSTVYGGSGDDRISVSGYCSNVSVDLGDGDDQLSLNRGAATITLGEGQDTIDILVADQTYDAYLAGQDYSLIGRDAVDVTDFDPEEDILIVSDLYDLQLRVDPWEDGAGADVIAANEHEEVVVARLAGGAGLAVADIQIDGPSAAA